MFLGMKTWYGQWHPCYHLAPQGSFWSRKGRSPCSTWNFHFRESIYYPPPQTFRFFFFVFFPSLSERFSLLGVFSLVTRNTLYPRDYCSVQFSCQLWPTLCNSMDYSMPGFTVHHQLLELAQIHVHQVSDAIQPSHPLLSPSPPALDLHQGLFKWVRSSSGSFQMTQLFTSGGQSIGVSASASVLPMNIQNWFPWGLTGWISLQSKGLSRPQFKGIHSSVPSFLYSPTLTSIHDYWKNHSFDKTDCFQLSNVSAF